MTRLDYEGRSYSVVREIVRFWESFIFVPTCVIRNESFFIKFLAQEKLRKVLTAFKAEKSQLENLNEKLETANSDLEIEKDKYSKTREAQKLAEVKVMELEQRLTTLTAKAKDAEDAKGINSRNIFSQISS